VFQLNPKIEAALTRASDRRFYGEVTITFRGGTPKLIRVQETQQLDEGGTRDDQPMRFDR
jgi:hypothetical protein